jgi:hypothetical protein
MHQKNEAYASFEPRRDLYSGKMKLSKYILHTEYLNLLGFSISMVKTNKSVDEKAARKKLHLMVNMLSPSFFCSLKHVI